MLRSEGLTIVPRALPDHHDFASLPWPAQTRDVVLTEKDAVKLRPERIASGGTHVWVAPLNFDPEVPFAAALKRHFPHPPAKH
jgi:tetraacyldisaccharide 4'-kinase